MEPIARGVTPVAPAVTSAGGDTMRYPYQPEYLRRYVYPACMLPSGLLTQQKRLGGQGVASYVAWMRT